MVHTAGRNKLDCNQIYRFKTEKVGFMMNRIKELRKQNNLSLKQLSKSLKEKGLSLSADSLSKYERGARNPKIENWVKLSKFFDVSVAYLKGEKQKDCPYCHPPYKPFISSGKGTFIDLENNSSPIFVGISNVLGEGPITETLCGVVNVLKLPSCPFCKRDLN